MSETSVSHVHPVSRVSVNVDQHNDHFPHSLGLEGIASDIPFTVFAELENPFTGQKFDRFRKFSCNRPLCNDLSNSVWQHGASKNDPFHLIPSSSLTDQEVEHIGNPIFGTRQ